MARRRPLRPGGARQAYEAKMAIQADLAEGQRIIEAEAELAATRARHAQQVEAARAATNGLRVSPAIALRNAQIRRANLEAASAPKLTPAPKPVKLSPAAAMARIAATIRQPAA